MTQTIFCSGEYPLLNLPFYPMQLKKIGAVTKVFDPLRRKFVILTPEEFVRQQFTNWLRSELHYPTSLMANEIGLDLNGTKKRCDTVIFDKNGAPLMIVEYKAPHVVITQDVFDQIVRYNIVLKAKYLIVTNGKNHYCCVIDYSKESYNFIPAVPDYKDLFISSF